MLSKTYPKFVVAECRRRRKQTCKRTLGRGNYVEFSRSSWQCMWPGDRIVLRSHLFAWIVIRGRRVGAVKINRYKANENCDNDDFCIILDGHSQAEYDLASVIGRSWDDVYVDLCLWGPILYLEDVWLDERFVGADVLVGVLQTLTQGPLRKHSIMLTNHRTIGVPNACIENAVNARAFPGRAGDRGWLWAPSPDDIDMVKRPTEQPRVSQTGYF